MADNDSDKEKPWNLDEILKKSFGTEKRGEKKMGKIKITVHFKEDLNEEEKEKVSDLMEEIGIKVADRKKYFENGGFLYPNSMTQKYDELVNMFGELATVTSEEIPPTSEELVSEAASKVIPGEIKKYVEAHKAELEGVKGDNGDNGDDGRDGKTWPAIVISLVALAVVVGLALLWHPMPAGTEEGIKRIDAKVEAGLANLESMRVGSIDAVAQSGIDALKAIKEAGGKAIEEQGTGKQPGVQQPGVKPGTQTPATGKTFEQQLQDAMDGKG